jgi:hypothetical protein
MSAASVADMRDEASRGPSPHPMPNEDWEHWTLRIFHFRWVSYSKSNRLMVSEATDDVFRLMMSVFSPSGAKYL